MQTSINRLHNDASIRDQKRKQMSHSCNDMHLEYMPQRDPNANNVFVWARLQKDFEKIMFKG